MSYSIMDMGNSTKAQSKGSLKTLADMEQNREITNNGIKQQKKSNQMSGTASGAMIGLSIGGPYGAAIGGAIGFIGGSL
jgi:uncharacterized protein YcfJ